MAQWGQLHLCPPPRLPGHWLSVRMCTCGQKMERIKMSIFSTRFKDYLCVIECFAWVHVCTPCVCRVFRGQKRGYQIPCNWSCRHCEAPRGCWKLHQGFQEEQPVLVTTEASLLSNKDINVWNSLLSSFTSLKHLSFPKLPRPRI